MWYCPTPMDSMQCHAFWRGDQDFRDRDGDAEQLRTTVPAGFDRGAQRASLDVLEHQKVDVIGFDVVVDAADVGMVE